MTHPTLVRCIDCGDGTFCGDKYEPCGCDCHEKIRQEVRIKESWRHRGRDEPTLTHCAVREGDGEWHIECRFSDGQKLAAIRVDGEFPALADRVAGLLNAKAWSSERPMKPGKFWLAVHPDQRGLLFNEGVYKVEVREGNHVYYHRGITRFSDERLRGALWDEITEPDDPFVELERNKCLRK